MTESNGYKLCPNRSNVIIFSVICVLCAVFVMIGFYTFFTRREKLKVASKEIIQSQSNTSNACPYWDLIGDGYCDDEANNENCNYDSEDCCDYQTDRIACQDCFCFVPEIDLQPICKDSLYVPFLGDGDCNLQLNNVEHYFDVGDCCLNNTVCFTNLFFDGFYCEFTCPAGICVNSNIYCNSSQLGDGLCQDHNNGPFCDYDFGDCCLPTRKDFDSCCACECKKGRLLDLLEDPDGQKFQKIPIPRIGIY